jgi:hypothetical protein
VSHCSADGPWDLAFLLNHYPSHYEEARQEYLAAIRLGPHETIFYESYDSELLLPDALSEEIRNRAIWMTRRPWSSRVGTAPVADVALAL